MMRRRQFITAGLATGFAWAADRHFPGLLRGLSGAPGWRRDRTLVLVELTGGNDGLNTFVPWADGRYHRARPALGIREAAVHRIDDAMGYAPALEKLAALHRDGHVLVIQNVGMPEPDRSHFTSLDRWHTGDVSGSLRTEGWLGRALAAVAPPDAALPGLALGERTLPRLLTGTDRAVAAGDEIRDLLPAPAVDDALRSPDLAGLDALWGRPEDRVQAAAARTILDALERMLGDRPDAPAIVPSPLGRQLHDVRRIVEEGLEVPAIFIRTSGFDTHARQDSIHPVLLRNIDATLVPFYRALAAAGLAERVLVVVYSEFGRRLAENGSRGTDHGAANPVFLLGGGLPGGVHGPPPDLGNLLDGDVHPTVDFRRVLAQALKHLGHPDPALVLGPEGRPLF